MIPDLLRELARPRLFGTAGAAHVEGIIRARLEGTGLVVESRPFRFSTLPGRFATPAIGAVLLCVFLGAAAFLIADRATPAAAMLVVTLLLLLTVPFLAGPAVERLPLGRAEGVNVVGAPPDAKPRFLVVAHRDSKSQAVPLGLRIAAVATIVVALPAAAVAAIAGTGLAIPLSMTGAAAAVVLLFCGAGNASPGALDNASGLAALLDLAAHGAAGDVAFLITDAEELGLAGARAAARTFDGLEAVINLDGLADDGPLRLLLGRGPGAAGRAERLREALARAARARGLEVRAHRVPAGLMVDHLPFAAGNAALTVMRGHVRALARVHRSADEPARVSGTGAIEIARIVEIALDSLRGPTSP